MIDSTNPRVMADNIRNLSGASGSQASDISDLQTAVGAQGDAISALSSYSSNEVDTGKTWIDGRKIYRRVLTGTTPSDNTATTVIDTTDMGIVEIVSFISSVFSSDSGVFRTAPGSTAWYIFGSNPGVRVYATSASYQNLPLTVIIEYLKDAAPSPEPVSLTSPSPEDETRSVEGPEISDPIERSEEPSDEIIEEPIVETKTTRKKTSTK